MGLAIGIARFFGSATACGLRELQTSLYFSVKVTNFIEWGLT